MTASTSATPVAGNGTANPAARGILDRLLLGLDPYVSFWVPDPVWLVIVDLCREVYGQPGSDLLTSGHKIYKNSVDANTITVYHYFQLWRDGGNAEVLPEQLVEELAKI